MSLILETAQSEPGEKSRSMVSCEGLGSIGKILTESMLGFQKQACPLAIYVAVNL